MNLASIVSHLRSDGSRGFGYDVGALRDLQKDRRHIHAGVGGGTDRSSISDAGEYPAFCRLASTDDEVFGRFRRSAIYMRILEHVTREQGKFYLEEIDPALMGLFEGVLRDDAVGGPRRYRFPPLGFVSPTTLRYVKVASDLHGLFGALTGLRVGEIGIGYGGQCRIIASAWKIAAYDLFDLPETLGLANRFLGAAGVDLSAVAEHDGRAPAETEIDLVISNYAFSELTRDVQQLYLDRVVLGAKRGYLTYNHISPPEFESFTAEEFVAMIPGARILPEKPKTAPDNVIVAWGMD